MHDVISDPLPMHVWVRDLMPVVLPNEWREEGGGTFGDDGHINGLMYLNDRRGLKAILSAAVELDGRRWLHLSVSHALRLPTWAEFVAAKEALMGRDRKAIQVLPPRREWVNISPHVLHLFACVDGDVLPDFTRGSGGL